MKRLLFIFFCIGILLTTRSLRAETEILPSLGAAVGKNLRPSAFASLRLSDSHTPLAAEAFAFVPWGVGAAMSIDAWRSERLTVKLFDLGIFFPILGKVSVPETNRNYDLVLGTGLIWRPGHNYNGHDLRLILNWRIFFPDPHLIASYGDFIRPIYNRAFRESFLMMGLAWK